MRSVRMAQMRRKLLSAFNKREDELMRRNREALDRNTEALERLTAAFDRLEKRLELTRVRTRLGGRQADELRSDSEAEREEARIRRRELVERAEGLPPARAV